MDYSALLRRAWELVRNHRALWWLGILAMLTEGGGGPGVNVPSSYRPRTHETGDKSSFLWPLAAAPLPASLRLLVSPLRCQRPDLDELRDILRRAVGSAALGIPLLLVVLLSAFLLALLVLYVALAAKAGLIAAVDRLDRTGRDLAFGAAFRLGQGYVWRLLGMGLLLGLAMLGAGAVLLGPPIALGVALRTPGAIIAAVGLGVIAVLALIALALYLAVLEKLASRFLVLTDCGIMNGLTAAHGLLRRRLGPTVVTWLIQVALGIAYSLATRILLLVVGVGMVAVGAGVYAVTRQIGLIAYAVVSATALLALFAFLGGLFTAFVSSYWTLAYQALGRLGAPPCLAHGSRTRRAPACLLKPSAASPLLPRAGFRVKPLPA